jgi:hypothetical protein
MGPGGGCAARTSARSAPAQRANVKVGPGAAGQDRVCHPFDPVHQGSDDRIPGQMRPAQIWMVDQAMNGQRLKRLLLQ